MMKLFWVLLTNGTFLWWKKYDRQVNSVGEYLDEENDSSSDLLMEDKSLRKFSEVIDIVNRSSANSCCFTKSYGRYADGTGSLIQQESVQEKRRFEKKKKKIIPGLYFCAFSKKLTEKWTRNDVKFQ